MTLRGRLLAAQGILALALLAVGVVAVTSLRTLGRSADTILQDNYRSVLAAQRIKDAAERLDSAALFRVAGRVDRAEEQARTNLRTLEEELAVQEGNITEPGEREATARLRLAWREYQVAFARLEGLQDRESLSRAYFDELEPRFIAVKAAAQQILDINQDAMVGKAERARRQATSLVLVVVVATAIGVLAGTLLSSWVTTRIVRPVSVVAQAAQRIATGDMAARARVKGRDEIAALAAEFNAMADKLAEYRRSSLGELLQAQQAAQAAIDGLPDPVLVLDVGGQVQNLNQAAEAMLRLPHGAGDLVAALDPPLREVVDRVRSHVLGGHGAWQPKGYEEAVRLELADGARWLLPRGHAAPLRGRRGDGCRHRAAGRLAPDARRRAEERPGGHRGPRVPHAAHLAAHGHPPLRRGGGRAAHREAGRPAAHGAAGLRAAAGDRRRPARPLPHPGRADGAAAPAGSGAGAARGGGRGVPRRRRGRRAPPLHPGVPWRTRWRPTPSGWGWCSPTWSPTPSGTPPPGARWRSRRPGAATVVRFEVRDTGEGIPREYLERIFERFFRVPGRGVGGVGLGPLPGPRDRPGPRGRGRRGERAGEGEHVLVHAPGRGRLRPRP